MLAWYSDISNLIEKTGDERNAYVRRHTRSMSAGSARSVSSDGGLEEDEADQVPFSTQQSMLNQPTQEAEPAPRPSPGGRFPSDIQVNRDLQAPVGPSSGSSSEVGNDLATASGGLQGTYSPYQTDLNRYDQYDQYQHYQQPRPNQAYNQDTYGYNTDNLYPQTTPIPAPVQQQNSYYANNPPTNTALNEHKSTMSSAQDPTQTQSVQAQRLAYPRQQSLERHDSTYGNWMAPAAGGATLGALGTGAYTHHQNQDLQNQQQSQLPLIDRTQTATELKPNPTAQPLPDGHPDHTAPLTNPVFAPIPVTSEREPDSLTTTPSTAHQPFLGGPEAALAAAASEKGVNGGPVNPGMKRQNTDFSVSDLHVPGQYPKTPGV